MKKEELEKYVGELTPELQEKARACKDMGELNALLAENDVELSDDALNAVAGGCGTPSYTVLVAEKYVYQGYPESFRGARLDGAEKRVDNCGGVFYYMIVNDSRGEEVTPGEYDNLVKRYHMIKVF